MKDNYRSMDLLWKIDPKTAEHLTHCYAVIATAACDLHIVSSREGIEDYIFAVDHLCKLGVADPESYLTYRDLNEAWSDFKVSAHWLVEYEIPERYQVFREGCSLFYITYRDKMCEGQFTILSFLKIINYLATHLGVTDKEAAAILCQEYKLYEEFLKKEEEEEF